MVMIDYHATLRKVGSQTPLSVQFSAKDHTDAIAELCAAAGVQNTNGLLEFEILEVLPHGQYKRAAVKLSRETSTAERLAANQAAVITPEPSKALVKTTLTLAEKPYTPYTKQLAA
jgi:hypothetical protein